MDFLSDEDNNEVDYQKSRCQVAQNFPILNPESLSHTFKEELAIYSVQN